MKELKTGVTTGLCAAAATKAAVITLLSGNRVEQVEAIPKNGEKIILDITDTIIENNSVKCAVQKYSGDDPDITNGVKVFAEVSKIKENIEIDGGEGIGRVTKPGLKIPVGRAAINPVPLKMITSAVRDICEQYSYSGGIKVIITIPNGEEIAKKTMNERLGVVGGLSVLGTTGIVEPMSTRAIVETIKAEIDVRIASERKPSARKKHLLITPGNYGRDFAKTLGLNIEEAVKCSNYIGETLDYVCVKGIENITLIGHAGKLVKLAGGIMNTHSSIADCRMEIIAAHSALAGAGKEVIQRIMECVTVPAAIEIMTEYNINDSVWKSIGKKIDFHINERVRGSVKAEYIIFTQEHGVLIHGKTR